MTPPSLSVVSRRKDSDSAEPEPRIGTRTTRLVQPLPISTYHSVRFRGDSLTVSVTWSHTATGSFNNHSTAVALPRGGNMEHTNRTSTATQLQPNWL